MKNDDVSKMYINEKVKEANRLFHEGFNCSQAVAGAFNEESGLNKEILMKAASSFGGGFGRLREVCGAVSGMCLVAGLLYGTADSNSSVKSAHYKLIQNIVEKFREENGAIVCRELLQLKEQKDAPESSKRNSEWYKKRPCSLLVETATRILAEKIIETN